MKPKSANLRLSEASSSLPATYFLLINLTMPKYIINQKYEIIF